MQAKRPVRVALNPYYNSNILYSFYLFIYHTQQLYVCLYSKCDSNNRFVPVSKIRLKTYAIQRGNQLIDAMIVPVIWKLAL